MTNPSTGQVSENVRYLLRQRDVPRHAWEDWLSRRLSWDAQRVRRLLRDNLADRELGSDDLQELSRLFELDDDGEDLRFRRFLGDHGDLVRQNLRFLLDLAGRGSRKALAQTLGIDPTTVSRWLNGSCEPQGPTRRQLATYFGLSSSTDLRSTPVFLIADSLTSLEQRQWSHERLEKISDEELRALYPALRRLLEER